MQTLLRKRLVGVGRKTSRKGVAEIAFKTDAQAGLYRSLLLAKLLAEGQRPWIARE
jgi:hypothetical protein